MELREGSLFIFEDEAGGKNCRTKKKFLPVSDLDPNGKMAIALSHRRTILKVKKQ
jgi:hypothetical protein